MATVKINYFAPTRSHANQRVVMDDPARFKLLRCGRKWRKTSLMVSVLMKKAALCKKGLTYPLVLPYQEQARETVWNDHVQRLLWEFAQKKLPHKKNETTLSVEFPMGGRFKLLGANNEIALRSASNWGYFGGDEFDDWKAGLWESVIRPNLMTHKAGAIIGGTPKGKRNIYQLSQSGVFKEFHFSSYDNPDLDREELDALVEDAKRKGEDYYLQEIMAEYIKPYGVVYKEWDETHAVDVPYDPNLSLHITFDWGINDPTAVIWIQPHASETRVIDYYEASDANIEHFISVIQSKPYKPAELYTGDPAGKARTLTTGTSVIDLLAKKGMYIKTTDGVKIPEQIRLAHGVMPGLYVDKTKAARFVDCLLNYRYPELNSTLRNQENEIPIHDEYSHGMRSFEYWVINSRNIIAPREYKQPSRPRLMYGGHR